MLMTHTRAKNQNQRLVSLKARVKTGGWTVTTDRITFTTNEVGNKLQWRN